MKPDPYISVIMPCYNEQENIARSVQSILDQTFTDFELIVIDDCSTDCSGNIIKHFAQKDSRIIYLKNEKNSGVAIALNKGLRIAKGIFVARIDADDVCEPTRFQKQIDYLKEHPECIICGTFADVFNGKEIVIQGNSQGNIKKNL